MKTGNKANIDILGPNQRLFATWTRYCHPVLPKSPVSFTEISRLKVVYCALFQGNDSNQRLLLFDKYAVNVHPLPTVSAPKNSDETLCYAVKRNLNNESEIGDPVTPAEAFASKEWIVPRVGETSKDFQLIKIERLSRTTYTYGGDGKLSNIEIEDASGYRVVDVQS